MKQKPENEAVIKIKAQDSNYYVVMANFDVEKFNSKTYNKDLIIPYVETTNGQIGIFVFDDEHTEHMKSYVKQMMKNTPNFNFKEISIMKMSIITLCAVLLVQQAEIPNIFVNPDTIKTNSSGHMIERDEVLDMIESVPALKDIQDGTTGPAPYQAIKVGDDDDIVGIYFASKPPESMEGLFKNLYLYPGDGSEALMTGELLGAVASVLVDHGVTECEYFIFNNENGRGVTMYRFAEKDRYRVERLTKELSYVHDRMTPGMLVAYTGDYISDKRVLN